MKAPLISFMVNCRVRYRGRAEARQTGGRLLTMVKSDGAVSVHEMTSGTKPQFYNPPGRVSARMVGGRLRITSRSTTGEVLTVSGEPVFVHELGCAPPTKRPPRQRVEGVEKDLVAFIQKNPSVVGLGGVLGSREVAHVGGRVDLQFGDVVVEVKRSGDVTAYDQALRYLRSRGVSRVVIACLHASRNLKDLCRGSGGIDLVVLD